MDLRTFLASRGVTQEAAGVLAGVDASTISRICSGESRARPATMVKLAKALGIAARRMQVICDASWAAAHEDEVLSA
jgi:transcriptional regulator with XRE-family HTH domain